MSNKQKQIDTILEVLKAKSKPTKSEQLFIDCAENQDVLTASDKDTFNKLIKKEWHILQAKKIENKLKEKARKEQEKKRKKRNHEIFLDGLILRSLINKGFIERRIIRQEANEILTKKADREVYNLRPLENR